MEIEVTGEKLAKALNNVSRITSSKATLPILNNVLIKVEDKKVSLITTNLDMAIIDYLPVSTSKNGIITVPAKLLADFISNLPKETKIKIISQDNKVTISAGKYSSIINGTPADDFPELPEINEKTAVTFRIGVEEFKNGVGQVIIASSNDFNRPALTGVYFYTKDKTLYLAATDGYRLAKKTLIKDVKSEVKVIVPSTSLQEVLRSIDDNVDEIELSFSEDLVRFRLGEIEVISKLIDAEYPDVDKLFSTDSEINFTINREELIRITKLASLFSRHGANDTITCEANAKNHTFSIHSIANEYGENDSVLEVKVDKDGKFSAISRYLIDALNNIDSEEVFLGFSEGINKTTGISYPMILKKPNSSDYIYIIMPVDA